MNRMLSAIALSLSLTTSVAALTEEDIAYCELEGRLAEMIMEDRQLGTFTQTEALRFYADVAGRFPTADLIIEWAYTYRIHHTEEAKRDRIHRFRDEVENSCLDSIRETG